ncbi:uncharacterized protein [Haliotis cracherodii]|uniref:uncharacterized protein n=1 Tax=Haliotis cracherodii TaxID=6455 RepID=UPI0039EA0988
MAFESAIDISSVVKYWSYVPLCVVCSSILARDNVLITSMKSLTAMAVVYAALTSPVSSGDKCAGGDVNGCTTLFKWVPYQSTFRSSCNRHDVCYACGSKYFKSQEECDKAFKTNMKAECSNFSCKLWANLYYLAVRTFGRFYYKDPHKTWCGQAWILNCL